MADTAAHLIGHVLPADPAYRQWTLSFPRPLRFRLLRDHRLASAVLGAFVRTVLAYTAAARDAPASPRPRPVLSRSASASACSPSPPTAP